MSAPTMQDRIIRIQQDLQALGRLFPLGIAPDQKKRLDFYIKSELKELEKADFKSLSVTDQTDFVLLKHYLSSRVRRSDIEARLDEKTASLRPFSKTVFELEKSRRGLEVIDGKKTAEQLKSIFDSIAETKKKVEGGIKMDRTVAFRGSKVLEEMKRWLERWFRYYEGYDPMFTWWAAEPYKKVSAGLDELNNLVREKLVGIKAGDKDTIVGAPIGRDGLLAELESEMITYTPEELLKIAEKEFAWCDAEVVKSSREMGFGDNWKKAQEKVKGMYVEPGKQTALIKDLALEAIAFVKSKDLVTVPPLAEETWRMEMMSPERQKVSPFFLGGETIIVSYPTNTMDHEAKMMSMRGNNIHFSRATVQHELIPGHHLQMFMTARYKPHRQMFSTPFWIEGWALYWEMVLWNKGFPTSPENRIGMLFWRMHRCARIIFSLKFHLGEMTPQQCIDFLVERVGHERATAEGEVRRSFNGDYPPLYQAAYMLGGLQIRGLREELVETGKMSEKGFHDRILQENQMPIEFLRSVLRGESPDPSLKPSWRFYPGL